MQGTQIVHTYHVPGTLSANITITFTAYRNMTLEHVSAGGSNANDGLLIVGISTDTNSILTSSSIGDSGTPAEFDRSDWATTNPTGHITDGQIVVFTLDYDGAGGTATDDFTLVATFTEG